MDAYIGKLSPRPLSFTQGSDLLNNRFGRIVYFRFGVVFTNPQTKSSLEKLCLHSCGSHDVG
ncbi:MAG: hypothetical protein AAGA31_19370 [Bacteroidota bacterium]